MAEGESPVTQIMYRLSQQGDIDQDDRSFLLRRLKIAKDISLEELFKFSLSHVVLKTPTLFLDFLDQCITDFGVSPAQRVALLSSVRRNLFVLFVGCCIMCDV